MRKRLAVGVAVALAAIAAAPACGTIGSVISSFDISYHGEGILAQGNYLYLSGYITYGNYIITYTHSGAYIRSRSIDPGNDYRLYSGSRTHLGPGYVALIDQHLDRLKIFSIANGGAAVTSFGVLDASHNVFWTGEYYYVNRWTDEGTFRRYTSSGSLSGTWTCAGWPTSMTYCYGAEYAQHGNYAAGPYFVAGAGNASRPYCMTTFPGGSLVATWMLPSPSLRHLSYGDSSNTSIYGAAIWATTTNPYGVREIDIDARNASSVLPASVGKIKAIYR